MLKYHYINPYLTYHNTSTDDRVSTRHRNLFVGYIYSHDAISICHNIAQVSSMSLLVAWSSMLLPCRVEVPPGTNAATAVVPKLVNMKPMFPFNESCDSSSNFSAAIALQHGVHII